VPIEYCLVELRADRCSIHLSPGPLTGCDNLQLRQAVLRRVDSVTAIIPTTRDHWRCHRCLSRRFR